MQGVVWLIALVIAFGAGYWTREILSPAESQVRKKASESTVWQALIQKGGPLLVYCTVSRCSHSIVAWPDDLRSGRNRSTTTTIAFNASQLPTKVHKPVMAFLQGFPSAFVFQTCFSDLFFRSPIRGKTHGRSIGCAQGTCQKRLF
jgi:hypothetical protein